MLTNLLILLPLIGALVIWVTPLPREATAALAVLIAVAEVVVWIVMVAGFDFASPVLQDAAQRAWFGDLGVTYHVGFYGFSLWLAGLTVVVGAAAIGFGAWIGRDRARAYFGLMLFLVGAVVGVFASDFILTGLSVTIFCSAFFQSRASVFISVPLVPLTTTFDSKCASFVALLNEPLSAVSVISLWSP